MVVECKKTKKATKYALKNAFSGYVYANQSFNANFVDRRIGLKKPWNETRKPFQMGLTAKAFNAIPDLIRFSESIEHGGLCTTNMNDKQKAQKYYDKQNIIINIRRNRREKTKYFVPSPSNTVTTISPSTITANIPSLSSSNIIYNNNNNNNNTSLSLNINNNNTQSSTTTTTNTLYQSANIPSPSSDASNSPSTYADAANIPSMHL